MRFYIIHRKISFSSQHKTLLFCLPYRTSCSRGPIHHRNTFLSLRKETQQRCFFTVFYLLLLLIALRLYRVQSVILSYWDLTIRLSLLLWWDTFPCRIWIYELFVQLHPCSVLEPELRLVRDQRYHTWWSPDKIRSFCLVGTKFATFVRLGLTVQTYLWIFLKIIIIFFNIIRINWLRGFGAWLGFGVQWKGLTIIV